MIIQYSIKTLLSMSLSQNITSVSLPLPSISQYFLFNRTLEKKAVISKSSMKIFHHLIYNVLFIGKFTKLLATFRNSRPILAFFEF